jgi:hypothetical protein
MDCGNPVMDAIEPCLQIAENEVDDWQKDLRHLMVPALGDGVVIVAARPQWPVPRFAALTVPRAWQIMSGCVASP